MFAHLEPVAQGGGDESRAGGGADEGEGLQLNVQRSRVDAFAEGEVDAEVFHGRVEELFDGLLHAVDFVDEEDGILFGVGEVGDEVLGGLESGAGADLEVDAEVARDAGGEGGLAEAGRAIEEDVAEGLAAFGGRLHGDLQSGVDFALTDHFVHVLGTEGAIVVGGIGRWRGEAGLVVIGAGGLQERFAGHRIRWAVR